MGVPFTKLHGLGNSYIFIDLITYPCDLPWAELARKVSDKHYGLGSDGLILILPSNVADARMRMFNADGSEGEMCGNGIRCMAKYMVDLGLSGPALTIETAAGVHSITVEKSAQGATLVSVDMGIPSVLPRDIPMSIGLDSNVPAVNVPIRVDHSTLSVTGVALGPPHCVVFVDEPSSDYTRRVGQLLEKHPAFPRRTNVNFVKVVSRNQLFMRVWERGSGETLACGTGACASLVAAVLTGRADRRAVVAAPGGELLVDWAADQHVYMRGPAEVIAHGVLQRDWLLDRIHKAGA